MELPSRQFVIPGFSGAVLGALTTLQRTLAAFQYISIDWASNTELPGCNLSKPFPGQAAQVLGCHHLKHHLEVLLSRLHASG